MNQTEHYGLSQWEKTDRIMMEDFNSDNAKLDAVLAEETATRQRETAALQDKTSLHTLRTATLEADSTGMTIDLTGIDWSQWKAVHICMDLQGKNSFFVAFNTFSDKRDKAYSIEGHHRMTLLPLYDADMPVHGFMASMYSCDPLGFDLTFRDLTSFTVAQTSSATFYQGCTMTIYGEK